MPPLVWFPRFPRKAKSLAGKARRVNSRPLKLGVGIEPLEPRTMLACNALIGDIVDGIDFEPLQTALTQALDLGAELPFVGKKIQELKPGEVIQKLEKKLKEKLPEVAGDKIKDAQKALKGILGTGWDKDDDGTVDVEGIDIASDVRIKSIDSDTGLAIEIDLKWENDPIKVPFDIGLDGLPIRIDDGEVAIRLGVNYKNFRIVIPNCLPEETRLDFSHNSQFSFTVSAGLEGAGVAGSIGFLALKAEDAGTRLVARFDLGVSDDENGFPQFSSVALSTELSEVWLHLTAGFTDSGAPAPDEPSMSAPSIEAKLHVQWDFENEQDLDQVDADFGEAPLVEFRDVTLKLGTYITDTLGPVIKEIQKAVDPIMPLINVLTDPIPVVSDLVGEVTLLDVAQFAGGKAAPEYQALIDLAAAVVEIVNIVDSIENVDENATVTIADRIVVADPNNKIREKHPDFGDILKKDWSSLVGEYQGNANVVNAVKEQIKKACPDDAPDDNTTSPCENLVGMIEKYQAGTAESIDIRFPFFDDPITSVSNLLLGHDTDLVSFTAQFAASAKTTYVDIPIGPISIELGGEVAIEAKLRIAYDTYGLRKSIDEGSPKYLADGFYLDTSEPAVFPGGPTRFMISGGLSAKASIDYTLIEAGIEGGLFATFTLSLDQSANQPGVDGDPAKLRPFTDELGDCVIQTDGGVYAFLDVFVEIGIDPLSIEFSENLAEQRLLDLGYTCTNPFAKPPEVKLASTHDDDAAIPAGTLRLNIGPNAGDRNYKTEEKNEVYEIHPDESDPTCILVTAFGFTQAYCGINKILAAAGDGNDRITVADGVKADVDLDGGIGDDQLVYRGSGKALLYGVSGNDILVAGLGDAELYGGVGDDVLQGGAGKNKLYGGPDQDTITGGKARTSVNEVYGEDGWDVLIAGPDGGLMDGGDGHDTLVAGAGGGTILGGPGNDSITWDATYAVPTMVGGPGQNSLDIFGSDQPESFTLSTAAAGQLKIEAPGGKVLLPQTITKVNVDGRGGADQITVHELTNARVTDIGINVSDNLFNDNAVDTIRLYGSESNGTYVVEAPWQPIQIVKDDILKFGGVMKITMQNTPSTKLIYTVRAMNLADDLTLDTLDGNDTIDVHSITGPTKILAGSGDDSITVHAVQYDDPVKFVDPDSPQDNLADYLTALDIDAGSGANNRLHIDESASQIADTVSVTRDKIWSNLLPAVNFVATGGAFGGGVAVTTGPHPDTVNVLNTLPTTTNVNTTGGNDHVVIESESGNLASILGPLAVDTGSGGNNVLEMNDTTANTGNSNVLITALEIKNFAGPADTMPIAYASTGGTLELQINGSDSAALAERFSVLGPSASVVLNANAGNDAVIVQGLSGAATINAGDGSDTIGVGDLSGKFDAIAGTVDVHGMSGTDLLIVLDHGTSAGQSYTLGTNFLSRFAAGMVAFDATVEQVAISTSNFVDTINVVATPVSPEMVVNAGSGADTVIGPNVANIWDIPANNTATLNTTVRFLGVENLFGGTSEDHFKLADGATLSGKVDGKQAIDTLDYSAHTSEIEVDLATNKATGIASFAGIETFVGGAASDTLLGRKNADTWTIQQPNQGVINPKTVRFESFENLAGNTDNDVFAFEELGRLDGSLSDKGGKQDTLDYSARTTGVTVNLTQGFATGVGGKVDGIEWINGSMGNDMLIGNSVVNVLNGGTGHDLLLGLDGDDQLTGGDDRDLVIGGAGKDKLIGGPHDDILVSGSTIHDTSIEALQAIVAEWTRTDLGYAHRVVNLRNGGGLNETTRLDSTSVVDDALLDLLTGAQGDDWFWASAPDLITDLSQPPEVVNDALPNVPPEIVLPSPPTVPSGEVAEIEGIQITDLDAGTADILVALQVPSGKLLIRTDVPSGVTSAQVIGNGTGAIQVTAPQAQINTTLASAGGLTFEPPAGFEGESLLTISANDLGNTGLGGPQSTSATLMLTVQADQPLNIDTLSETIQSGGYDQAYDFDSDGDVDHDDLSFYVTEVLQTSFGDANLDGVFDSSDLVQIFQAGQFEDGIPGNSTWATGDWNADGEFDTADLVVAFQSGKYSG